MEEKYYCKTEKGVNAPKYVHTSFESAKTEAKRLHDWHGQDVEILKVVAKWEWKEVPVTKLESTFTSNNDDLPF